MDLGGHFTFQHLPGVKFPGFEIQSIQELLAKWSMMDGIKVQTYSFNKNYQLYLQEQFVKDFFSSRAVTSTLEKATPDKKWTAVGIPADKIKFSNVKSTLTSMTMLDKVCENPEIVRKSGSVGHIVKCAPNYFQPELVANKKMIAEPTEIELSDMLHLYIVRGDDDEELAGLLTPEEKDEFLYRLFCHLVIGGSLCQYEDTVEPYLETARLLYKNLMAVSKCSETGSVKVLSHVIKIHSACCESFSTRDTLFHKPEYNNFMYIVIHPVKQMCFTFYHHV